MPQQARIKAATVKKISQTKKSTRARFKLSKALQATIKKAVKMHGATAKKLRYPHLMPYWAGTALSTQDVASLDRIATTQRAQPKTRSAKPTIKA